MSADPNELTDAEVVAQINVLYDPRRSYKLTLEQVREIRNAKTINGQEWGIQTHLALKFGVSVTTIYNVRHNITYKGIK